MHESGSHRPFGISIHALRKESDAIFNSWLEKKYVISIHALRKESDEATARPARINRISIHALRKESDEGELTHDRTGVDFNPRSP